LTYLTIDIIDLPVTMLKHFGVITANRLAGPQRAKSAAAERRSTSYLGFTGIHIKVRISGARHAETQRAAPPSAAQVRTQKTRAWSRGRREDGSLQMTLAVATVRPPSAKAAIPALFWLSPDWSVGGHGQRFS